MKLDQLETLICFSETSTFTEAGRKLGITGVAVGKKLKELESLLGQPIINRSKQRPSLTPFGAEIAAKSRKILANVEELHSFSNQHYEALSGKIKVLTHTEHMFGLSILPWLNDFHRTHPRIEIELIQTIPLIDDLLSKVDVYWGVGRYLGKNSPGLIRRKLVSVTYGIYASPEYVDRKGIPTSLADLEHHSMVATTSVVPDDHLFYALKDSPSSMESKKMFVTLKANRPLEELIATGLGIGNCVDELPTTQRLLQKGKLIPILSQYWAKNVEIFVYYDCAIKNQPHVQAFIDFFLSKVDQWQLAKPRPHLNIAAISQIDKKARLM